VGSTQKIEEEAVTKWIVTSTEDEERFEPLPPLDARCNHEFKFKPTISANATFEHSVENGGGITGAKLAISDIINGAKLMDPHSGEPFFYSEIKKEEWSAKFGEKTIQISQLHQQDWSYLITCWALQKFNENKESAKRLLLSVVSDAGKSRVITVPPFISKVILSVSGHSYLKSLERVESLSAAITTSDGLWDFYRRMESHHFGTDFCGLENLRAVSCDYTEGSDHMTHESAKYVLHMLSRLAKTPKMIFEAEQELCSAREIYLDRKGAPICWTRKNVPMGDGNTKAVFQYSQGQILDQIDSFIRTKYPRWKGLRAANGDNIIFCVPKELVLGSIQILRRFSKTYGFVISELDLIHGSYVKYCDRFMRFPVTLDGFYTRIMHSRNREKYFPILDVTPAKLISQGVSSNSGDYKTSILSRLQAITRFADYASSFHLYGNLRRIRNILKVLIMRIGSRVRHIILHEPLTHEGYIYIPPELFIATWQHLFIKKWIIDKWGWNGHDFKPNWHHDPEYALIRTRYRSVKCGREVHIINSYVPEFLAKGSIIQTIELRSYLSLVNVTTKISMTTVISELIKYLNSVARLFDLDIDGLFDKKSIIKRRFIIDARVTYKMWETCGRRWSFLFRGPETFFTPEFISSEAPFLWLPPQKNGYDSVLRDTENTLLNGKWDEGTQLYATDEWAYVASLLGYSFTAYTYDNGWADIPGCTIVKPKWKSLEDIYFENFEGRRVIIDTGLYNSLLVKTEEEVENPFTRPFMGREDFGRALKHVKPDGVL